MPGSPLIPKYAYVDPVTPLEPFHPLNRGRMVWWLAPPGISRFGTKFLDLLGRFPASLQLATTWSSGTGVGKSITYPGLVSAGQDTGGAENNNVTNLPLTNANLTISYTLLLIGTGGQFLSLSPVGSANGIGLRDDRVQVNSSGTSLVTYTAATVPTRVYYVQNGTTNTAYVAALPADIVSVSTSTTARDSSAIETAWFLKNSYTGGLEAPGAGSWLADVSIWNRALSFNEVSADYRSAVTGYQTPNSPLRWRSSKVYFTPTDSGGGTTYNVTTADSLALTDAISRLASSFRLLGDNLGVTDAVTRQVPVSYRATADNLGVTDTVARAAPSFRTASDNLGVTDTVARRGASSRTASDNIGVTDAVSRTAPSSRSTSDNLGVTDAVSRVAPAFRTTSDNLAITDAVARTAPSFRTTADNLALTDIVSRRAASSRLLQDSAGLSDTVSRLATCFRAVADNLALTDACTRTATSSRTASDSAGLTDAISRQVTGYRLTADSVGLADTVARQVASYRLVLDFLAITDSVTVTLIQSGVLTIQVVELLGLADSLGRAVASYRLVVDSVALLTAATVILNSVAAVGGRRFTSTGRDSSTYTSTGRSGATYDGTGRGGAVFDSSGSDGEVT